MVLTVITVIFNPLTFIAGLYGMNFRNMPELTWKYGYFYALILMVAVAGGLFIWFRKKGWFNK
jgi:magnesium transporter